MYSNINDRFQKSVSDNNDTSIGRVPRLRVGVRGYFATGAGNFIFVIASKPAELPTQPPVQSNRGFFPKDKRRGVKLITQLSLVSRLKIE
jgi:hypothetical protein